MSAALDVLPSKAQSAGLGATPADHTSYALTLHLFAPLAVVVP